jgi:Holliday junction resolvase RusA-like endonuclease
MTTAEKRAVRAEAAGRYRNLLDHCTPSLPWHLDVWVPGKPVTKGSTTAYAISAPNTKRGMRAVTTAANDPEQKAWGAHVREAVVTAWGEVSQLGAPTAAPVVVWCEFVMPRRASAPKGYTEPHTRKPDTDKLLRMIGDQLTHVVVTDDATTVLMGGVKREAEPDEAPGARIRVCVLAWGGAS